MVFIVLTGSNTTFDNAVQILLPEGEEFLILKLLKLLFHLMYVMYIVLGTVNLLKIKYVQTEISLPDVRNSTQ